jgi:lipopolysaccharide heptosyltransferase II
MANSERPVYRRILLTRMKFIGDVILTTPLLRSLRTAYPGAFISYMGERHAVSLLEGNPFLDDLIPFDFSRPTLIEQPRIAWALRRRKFDLAIDLFGNPRSALLTWLSGATVRVGPARKGRGQLYTIQVRDDGHRKTAIAFHNQYLTAAGIPVTSQATEIFLSDAERREARIYLRWLLEGKEGTPGDPPILALHPGATWPAKRWLPERFGSLADLAAARLGARVILIGGPNDGPVVEETLRSTVSNVVRLPVLPLRPLAAVLSHCAAVVANDAGPMHIAAALGIPTIGIFGPGEEDIWFPYDAAAGHRPLRKDVVCHPCHLDVCNRPGEGYMECMKNLTLDEVFVSLQSIMRR